MSLFDHFLAYEVCFPGGVTGETELNCPYCGELLTVPVNDPMGEEVYQCCECTGTFEVNWGEGQVRYQAVVSTAALRAVRTPPTPPHQPTNRVNRCPLGSGRIRPSKVRRARPWCADRCQTR